MFDYRLDLRLRLWFVLDEKPLNLWTAHIKSIKETYILMCNISLDLFKHTKNIRDAPTKDVLLALRILKNI